MSLERVRGAVCERGVVEGVDERLDVVAALHGAEQVHGLWRVDHRRRRLALGHRRQEARLDVGGLIHARGHPRREQLEELLAEEKAAMVSKEEELAETIDRLEDEKRQAVSEAEESHETALVEIEQRQIDETKGLKEEFRKDAEANEAKMALLERKYDELVVKYENRESRGEDLDRMAELEAALRRAEEEVSRPTDLLNQPTTDCHRTH